MKKQTKILITAAATVFGILSVCLFAGENSSETTKPTTVTYETIAAAIAEKEAGDEAGLPEINSAETEADNAVRAETVTDQEMTSEKTTMGSESTGSLTEPAEENAKEDSTIENPENESVQIEINGYRCDEDSYDFIISNLSDPRWYANENQDMIQDYYYRIFALSERYRKEHPFSERSILNKACPNIRSAYWFSGSFEERRVILEAYDTSDKRRFFLIGFTITDNYELDTVSIRELTIPLDISGDRWGNAYYRCDEDSYEFIILCLSDPLWCNNEDQDLIQDCYNREFALSDRYRKEHPLSEGSILKPYYPDVDAVYSFAGSFEERYVILKAYDTSNNKKYFLIEFTVTDDVKLDTVSIRELTTQININGDSWKNDHYCCDENSYDFIILKLSDPGWYANENQDLIQSYYDRVFALSDRYRKEHPFSKGSILKKAFPNIRSAYWFTGSFEEHYVVLEAYDISGNNKFFVIEFTVTDNCELDTVSIRELTIPLDISGDRWDNDYYRCDEEGYDFIICNLSDPRWYADVDQDIRQAYYNRIFALSDRYRKEHPFSEGSILKPYYPDVYDVYWFTVSFEDRYVVLEAYDTSGNKKFFLIQFTITDNYELDTVSIRELADDEVGV